MNSLIKKLRILFNKEIKEIKKEKAKTKSYDMKRILAGKIVGYTEAFNIIYGELKNE